MAKDDPAAEEARQRALLATPPGVPGSGRVRYAAAMALRQAGAMDDEALEAFRILSPLDDADPADLPASRPHAFPRGAR